MQIDVADIADIPAHKLRAMLLALDGNRRWFADQDEPALARLAGDLCRALIHANRERRVVFAEIETDLMDPETGPALTDPDQSR